MAKYFIYILAFIISSNLFSKDSSVTYFNITGNQHTDVRKSLIRNPNNPGIRVAWVGFKAKNTKYGGGFVDNVTDQFEKDLQTVFKNDFAAAHPGVEVNILKTEFKGYYITCNPSPSCLNAVESFSDLFPKVTFNNGDEFRQTIVRADNYQDGYVRARVMETYGDKYKEPLGQFLDNRLKEAVREATGKNKMTSIDPNDAEFMEKLSRQIELARGEKFDSMDPKFKNLVQVLDSLETPFASSNNLEQDLKVAMDEMQQLRPGEKFTVQSAISGDDLFMVIKDEKGKVVKIVGADAKGLGVLNMTERYKSFVGHLSSGRNNSITDMKQVYSLSLSAMQEADEKMASSINSYRNRISDIIQGENVTADNIDKFIDQAHKEYHLETLSDPELMQMRTAAIPSCGTTECVKNSISDIHNLLKNMEKAGYQGHFGDSCLGVQYWLKKYKIPRADSRK